jgi:hypothetical protein
MAENKLQNMAACVMRQRRFRGGSNAVQNYMDVIIQSAILLSI